MYNSKKLNMIIYIRSIYLICSIYGIYICIIYILLYVYTDMHKCIPTYVTYNG